MKDIDEIMSQLPPELQRELRDFAEYLLEKQRPRKQTKLRLSWAGGLKEYRDQFTSLDLQRKALEWWGD
jgi:galactose-1-phosphate uridylyltransferase